MPESVNWNSLQARLVERGFLAHQDVVDVEHSRVVSSALQRAINRAQERDDASSPSHGSFIDVRLDDQPTLADAASRLARTLGQPYCVVDDQRSGAGMHVLSYGSPRGRWSHGDLKIFIDTANCVFTGVHWPLITTPALIILGCFHSWQKACPYFSFTQATTAEEADIVVRFGGTELDTDFTGAHGVLASGGYPDSPLRGKLSFDKHETWTPSMLQQVARHEIGHCLGLQHSDVPNTLMYPYANASSAIDGEALQAIRSLYSWAPQTPITWAGTSDRPCLACTGGHNFTARWELPFMVWKGVDGDSGIYWSRFNGDWSFQQRVSNVGCSYSPALVEIPDSAMGGLGTGLLMAWKGAGDDQGIYWLQWGIHGWGNSQSHVDHVGTSHAPALGMLNGQVYMAWKGVKGDSAIYWSRWRGTHWDDQKHVDGVATTGTPALAALGDRLYMFWRGAGDDSNIWYSSCNYEAGQPWAPQQRVQFTSYSASSDGTSVTSSAPTFPGTSGGMSATSLGDRIFLAWKGVAGDQAIWYSYFKDGEFTGQASVAGIGTATGPTVTNVDGTIYMAWRGIDNDKNLWWSKL